MDKRSLVCIYGHSDDLIEVEELVTHEVDVTLESEFDRYSEGQINLQFDSGTIINVSYTDEGTWRVTPVHIAESDHIERFYQLPENHDEDKDGYTDKLYLLTTAKEVWDGDQ